MTIIEIVTVLRQRGLCSARQDMCAAQNSVNRVLEPMGRIGRNFDSWFRLGRTSGLHIDDDSLDLLIEAIALAANVVGSERLAELLEQRLRR